MQFFVLLRFFSDPLAFTSSQSLTLLLLVTDAVKAPLPHLQSHRSLRYRWQYYFNVNNLSPAPYRRSFSNGATPPPRTIVTPHHLFTINNISAQTYPAHHRAPIVWMWLSFAHGWVSKDPLSTSAHTSCFRDLCMCAGTPITGYCSFPSTNTNLISNHVLFKVSDWVLVRICLGLVHCSDPKSPTSKLLETLQSNRRMCCLTVLCRVYVHLISKAVPSTTLRVVLLR